MGIINEGDNINTFGVPDVIVEYMSGVSTAQTSSPRVAQLIGDFTWGPELVSTPAGDMTQVKKLFGNYDSSLKGWLDAYTCLNQGCDNFEIIRIIPPDGTPVASVYTIENLHYYMNDAGNIVKFIALDSAVTVKIANGGGSNKTITIDEGLGTEEVYTDLDMNEANPPTYIIDVINASSSIVRVERLSGLTVDTLPTNQSSTLMTLTVEREILTLTAKTAGLNGDQILISTVHNIDGTFNLIGTDLITEKTEEYLNLNMIIADPAYAVTVITAGSAFLVATRSTTNASNLIPKVIDTTALTGGSDGGLTYASATAQDAGLNDIVTFTAKYRGSEGNNISYKITNKTTYVNIEIVDHVGDTRSFKNLNMNSSSANYLVDVINNSTTGSDCVTVTRVSDPATLTLPANNSSFVSLTGGSNGDPINDTSIQDGIDISEHTDDIDLVSYGYQSVGTANANAIAIKDMAESRKERRVVINSASGATEAQCITFKDDVTSSYVTLTHPCGYIRNPITNNIEAIGYAAAVMGAISTLAPETPPTRVKLKGFLGNTRPISVSGDNAIVTDLCENGICAIAKINGSWSIVDGLTTSNEYAYSESCIVDMRSFIAKSLISAMQPYVGKLNKAQLRTDVYTTIHNLLYDLFIAERIGDPNTPTPEASFYIKCDETNNPASVRQNKKLIAEVKVLLLSPANWINIKLTANDSVVIAE